MSYLELLLLTISASHIRCQPSLTTTPNDVTVSVGTAVQFLCAPALTTDILTWTLYQNQVPPVSTNKLFTVTSSGQASYQSSISPAKYYPNNTWDLVVASTQLGDGDTYGCGSTSAQTDAYANLVVIGALLPTVMGFSSSQSSLTVGQYVTFQCTLNYGAPNGTLKVLSPQQNPQLAMFIGTTQVQVTVLQSGANQKIAYYNTTAQQSYVGQNLTCQVTSQFGQNFQTFTSSSTMVIPIPYGPTNLQINTTSYTLQQNSVVNCSASGYPPPQVAWVPALSWDTNPSVRTSAPGWALLTLTRLGSGVSWNCTATSSATGATVGTSFTFIVENASGATSGARSGQISGFMSCLLGSLILFSVWPSFSR